MSNFLLTRKQEYVILNVLIFEYHIVSFINKRIYVNIQNWRFGWNFLLKISFLTYLFCLLFCV
nr:MAG TPA: hypothetical protein [Caudoviricetes sp.]DAY67880.1 MAG TPA: hypothetical protein [Caudoviricetes sp.]